MSAPVQYIMSPQPVQGPVIVGMPQPTGQSVIQNGYYNRNQCGIVKGMAIAQIVMGGVLLVFGVIEILLDNSLTAYIGGGIWIGILYQVSGIIGVIAAQKNKFGVIMGCMVMNIISSVACAVLLGFASASISYNRCSSSYGGYSYRCTTVAGQLGLAIDSLSLIMSLVQLGITIATSAICCGAVCCRTATQPNQNMIVYQAGFAPQPTNVYFPGPGAPYTGVQPLQPPNYAGNQMVHPAPQTFAPASASGSGFAPLLAGVHHQEPSASSPTPPPYQH